MQRAGGGSAASRSLEPPGAGGPAGGGGSGGCRSSGGGGGISSSHDPTVCPRDQRERLPCLLRPLLPRGVSAGLGAPPGRPPPPLPSLPSPPPPSRAPSPPRPRPPHGHAGPGSGSCCLGHRCCCRQVRAPVRSVPPHALAPALRPGRHDPERPPGPAQNGGREGGGPALIPSAPGPCGAPAPDWAGRDGGPTPGRGGGGGSDPLFFRSCPQSRQGTRGRGGRRAARR